MNDSNGQCRVAQLLCQLKSELETLRRGMTDLATGTAHPESIGIHLERIGSYQKKLASYVGDLGAAQIVRGLYIDCIDQ